MKPDYTEMFASGEGAILAGVFLTVLGIVSALGLLLYVLQAWSVYTIARRRGIRKPWLAWIPVAGVWTVGSIEGSAGLDDRHLRYGCPLYGRRILYGGPDHRVSS